MFYGRKNEIAAMNRRYEKNKFECIVIYGRRRIGKTALINEFCKDKPTIFFSALKATAQENLDALSKAIGMYLNPDAGSFPVYRSFEDAFNAITECARQDQLVFVIDEYPYLAKADESISSRLQHIIDHLWQDSKLFLILCGSSMSFMQHQVLGYESPLYGRRTGQFKIEPMTYRECTVFYSQLTPSDQALLYGVTGGIPHYLNKLEIEKNLDAALIEHFFDPAAYLFEEPENLLKQELREPSVYNSIIAAIAGGASRVNEIATKVGLDSSSCMKYLHVLRDLGIVIKESPFAEKNTKKTIYLVDDNFFRFWYRFVPQNLSMIQAGRTAQIYEKTIKPYYAQYMGLIFEKICKDYLLRYAKDLPVLPTAIGQWWGSDASTRKQIQIDIVCSCADQNEFLIGSCKYRNEAVGCEELALLKQYAEVFRPGAKFHYLIFSKSGFTDALQSMAKNENINLITLEDLYKS